MEESGGCTRQRMPPSHVLLLLLQVGQLEFAVQRRPKSLGTFWTHVSWLVSGGGVRVAVREEGGVVRRVDAVQV
jgi:hypothetical protein